MAHYLVPVTITMHGVALVEADSPADARRKAQNNSRAVIVEESNGGLYTSVAPMRAKVVLVPPTLVRTFDDWDNDNGPSGVVDLLKSHGIEVNWPID